MDDDIIAKDNIRIEPMQVKIPKESEVETEWKLFMCHACKFNKVMKVGPVPSMLQCPECKSTHVEWMEGEMVWTDDDGNVIEDDEDESPKTVEAIAEEINETAERIVNNVKSVEEAIDSRNKCPHAYPCGKLPCETSRGCPEDDEVESDKFDGWRYIPYTPSEPYNPYTPTVTYGHDNGGKSKVVAKVKSE